MKQKQLTPARTNSEIADLPLDVEAPRCPYCHEDVKPSGESKQACTECMAWHHTACWNEQRGCAACGLTGAVATKTKSTAKNKKYAKLVAARLALVAGFLSLTFVGGIVFYQRAKSAVEAEQLAERQARMAAYNAQVKAEAEAETKGRQDLVTADWDRKTGRQTRAASDALRLALTRKDLDEAYVMRHRPGRTLTLNKEKQFSTFEPTRRDGIRRLQGERLWSLVKGLSAHWRSARAHPHVISTYANASWTLQLRKAGAVVETLHFFENEGTGPDVMIPSVWIVSAERGHHLLDIPGWSQWERELGRAHEQGETLPLATRFSHDAGSFARAKDRLLSLLEEGRLEGGLLRTDGRKLTLHAQLTQKHISFPSRPSETKTWELNARDLGDLRPRVVKLVESRMAAVTDTPEWTLDLEPVDGPRVRIHFFLSSVEPGTQNPIFWLEEWDEDGLIAQLTPIKVDGPTERTAWERLLRKLASN